jgi:hypothetical protein
MGELVNTPLNFVQTYLVFDMDQGLSTTKGMSEPPNVQGAFELSAYL